MTTYDETFQALAAAFATLSAAGDVDVVGDDADGIDVMADTWTIHIEGWPGPKIAWLALDDEPSDGDVPSIPAALTPASLAAIAESDRMLDGKLVTALLAANDAVSAVLATVVSTS